MHDDEREERLVPRVNSMGDESLDIALRAAAVLARRGPASGGVGVARAVDAARAASASLPTESVPEADPAQLAGDVVAAARAAAAAAAANIGLGAAAAGSSSEGAPPADPDAAKRAAAAAFAESIRKRPRWGQGSSALVDAPVRDPGKERQALAVSQLKDKLAAFRKDRGIEELGPTSKHSLKLFVPEKEDWMREPRNWVGIFIGRDGKNKKRFEEEVPGARIFIRGEGTQLRGAKKVSEDDVEAMHVYLEADSQDALDAARVNVLATLNPKRDSSALTLFDEKQLVNAALEKTTDKEECAFCGKPGHHHSKCPTRKTKFTMSGIKCAACGSTGHTAKDCKGDRSNVVNMASANRGPGPSVFEDKDFAAFEAELLKRAGGS